MRSRASFRLTVCLESALCRHMACIEPPELQVARAMRDHAKLLRTVADSPEMAKAALEQEIRFSQQVDQLEAGQTEPELPLQDGNHHAA